MVTTNLTLLDLPNELLGAILNCLTPDLDQYPFVVKENVVTLQRTLRVCKKLSDLAIPRLWNCLHLPIHGQLPAESSLGINVDSFAIKDGAVLQLCRPGGSMIRVPRQHLRQIRLFRVHSSQGLDNLVEFGHNVLRLLPHLSHLNLDCALEWDFLQKFIKPAAHTLQTLRCCLNTTPGRDAVWIDMPNLQSFSIHIAEVGPETGMLPLPNKTKLMHLQIPYMPLSKSALDEIFNSLRSLRSLSAPVDLREGRSDIEGQQKRAISRKPWPLRALKVQPKVLAQFLMDDLAHLEDLTVLLRPLQHQFPQLAAPTLRIVRLHNGVAPQALQQLSTLRNLQEFHLKNLDLSSKDFVVDWESPKDSCFQALHTLDIPALLLSAFLVLPLPALRRLILTTEAPGTIPPFPWYDKLHLLEIQAPLHALVRLGSFEGPSADAAAGGAGSTAPLVFGELRTFTCMAKLAPPFPGTAFPRLHTLFLSQAITFNRAAWTAATCPALRYLRIGSGVVDHPLDFPSLSHVKLPAVIKGTLEALSRRQSGLGQVNMREVAMPPMLTDDENPEDASLSLEWHGKDVSGQLWRNLVRADAPAFVDRIHDLHIYIHGAIDLEEMSPTITWVHRQVQDNLGEDPAEECWYDDGQRVDDAPAATEAENSHSIVESGEPDANLTVSLYIKHATINAEKLQALIEAIKRNLKLEPVIMK